MSCHCKNSIKLKILKFITENNQCILIDDAIIQMLTIIKTEIKDIVEFTDSFLMSYIRGLITELINEKIISLSEININEEQSNNNDYYYFMKFTQPIDDIFKHKDIIKDNQDIIKEEIIKQDKEDYNNLHQAKVEEYLQLKKTLEKTKKESRSQELIKILHKYNELKDIAQELIGRIANQRNIRIKELYEELEISDDEE